MYNLPVFALPCSGVQFNFVGVLCKLCGVLAVQLVTRFLSLVLSSFSFRLKTNVCSLLPDLSRSYIDSRDMFITFGLQ